MDELRKNIAVVLQDTHLFTGTVRENIRCGRLNATDEEVIVAAKMASAHSFIRILPDGYDTQDRTTFVIAHRLSTVRDANAIMVLEKGEIIERGTHDDLLKLGGRY